MNYKLIDGVERNSENPDTFWIPSEENKNNVDVGFLCKLGFEELDESFGERMWVAVTQKTEGGFVGLLRNQPVALDLNFGDVIHFQTKHIIGIVKDDE